MALNRRGVVHRGSCANELLAMLEATGARVGVSGAFVEVVHDQGKEEREQEGPEAPRV